MAYTELANPLIPIGSSYDSTKFILGNTANTNFVELIPKLSLNALRNLTTSSTLKVGYKIFNIATNEVSAWTGSSWSIINNATAANLVANNSDGQTIIHIANSNPPSIGQVLTATSATSASWAEGLAGAAVFPDQTGNNAKFLTTNGTTVSWSFTPTYLANPMSASGDIIIGGTLGAAGRLGIGSPSQVLTVQPGGTTLGWSNPIAAVGTGTAGKLLTNDGTSTIWQTYPLIPTISGAVTSYLLSNDGTNATWIVNNNPPSVTGQAGKFLTNNGSSLQWSSISQLPSITGTTSGKLLTNDGSSSSWVTLDAFLPSQTGKAGDVFTTDGMTASWQTPSAGFVNPMTDYADLIVGSSFGTAVRLPSGTNGQVLTSHTAVWNGTAFVNMLSWDTLPNFLTNPMTGAGDIIYGGASGDPVRLAPATTGPHVLSSSGGNPEWVPFVSVATVNSGVSGLFLTNNGSTTVWGTIPSPLPSQTGHNGAYLTTDGTTASWATIPSGFANPMTTTGDMISANSGGVAGRLAIGSTGQVLTVVSGGPAWSNIPSQLPSQTGNSGYFLSTNGSSPSWTQITQLVPTVSGGTSGFFLGNNGSSYSWMAVPNQLPSVSGQNGKYLSNDGTSATWVPYAGVPSVTGNSGKILTNDGTVAFWQSASSTTTLGLVPLTFTSSSLAVAAEEIDTVSTTCLSFQLQTIAVSSPCRIRIYSTHANAVADQSRPSTQDPSGNTGLFAEFVFISTALSWIVSPGVYCFNNDSTPITSIYIAIQNTGSTPAAITITASLLKMS